jgi:hypothetical protein
MTDKTITITEGGKKVIYLKPGDMHSIAEFWKIVKNYIKIKRLNQFRGNSMTSKTITTEGGRE